MFGAFLMINDPCLSQLKQCYIAEGEWYIFIFSGPSSKNKVFPFQKRSSKGAAAEIQPDTSCKCFTYCRKNMQKSIHPKQAYTILIDKENRHLCEDVIFLNPGNAWSMRRGIDSF